MKNGGPAFARSSRYTEHVQNGMSLRDYYAAHSPYGVNQALDLINGIENRNENNGADIEEISKALAKINYSYADAMIAARKI